MRHMKNIFNHTLIVLVTVALALPALAQQEWQSTSAMRGSGSKFVSQVTTVGATETYSMAYTTTDYTPSSSRGAHKAPPINPRPGDNPVPIGDAFIPLLLMVMAYATSILLRRRKSRV